MLSYFLNKPQAFAWFVADIADLVARQAANYNNVQRVVDYKASPFSPVWLCVGYPVRSLPCGSCESLPADFASAAAYCQRCKSLLLLGWCHTAFLPSV